WMKTVLVRLFLLRLAGVAARNAQLARADEQHLVQPAHVGQLDRLPRLLHSSTPSIQVVVVLETFPYSASSQAHAHVVIFVRRSAHFVAGGPPARLLAHDSMVRTSQIR